MIEVDIQEWQQLKKRIFELQQQINVLKQENERLKKKKLKKKVNFSNNLQVLGVQVNQLQLNEQNPQKFERKFTQIQKQKSPTKTKRKLFKDNDEKSQLVQQKNEELKLVQKISIFGPNLQNINQITFKNDQRQYTQSFLYHPKLDNNYEKYGNYIHPKMIRIKPIQYQRHQTQANKVLFQKVKKQSQKIFIFQGLPINSTKQSFQLMKKVNTSKFLFGIMVQYKDFIITEQKSTLKKNKSAKLLNPKETFLNLDVQILYKEQIKLQSASMKDIEFQNQLNHMYLTTFSICIFTYFPFLDYFQTLLMNLLEQVQSQRIQKYHLNKTLKEVDAFYFIKLIQNKLEKVSRALTIPIDQIGEQLSLKINNMQLGICLNGYMIIQELQKGWIAKILKMLNRDILYELYCLVMLQQPVYIICQDSRRLTLLILLLSSILTRPFEYPYPVVSIIFNDQLLQTPFTTIIGINEPIQWIENQENRMKIDLEMKNVVLISQNETEIIRNFKFVPPKSQKLLQIFRRFYQKSKSNAFSLKDLFGRKQHSKSNIQTAQQNQNVQIFFSNLQQYFEESIFSYLPTKSEIKEFQEKLGNNSKTPQSINQILDEILRRYKQSNPSLIQDEFLNEFIVSEIFSIYLSEHYQLKNK